VRGGAFPEEQSPLNFATVSFGTSLALLVGDRF
jgi:hypothetical protein